MYEQAAMASSSGAEQLWERMEMYSHIDDEDGVVVGKNGVTIRRRRGVHANEIAFYDARGVFLEAVPLRFVVDYDSVLPKTVAVTHDDMAAAQVVVLATQYAPPTLWRSAAVSVARTTLHLGRALQYVAHVVYGMLERILERSQAYRTWVPDMMQRHGCTWSDLDQRRCLPIAAFNLLLQGSSIILGAIDGALVGFVTQAVLRYELLRERTAWERELDAHNRRDQILQAVVADASAAASASLLRMCRDATGITFWSGRAEPYAAYFGTHQTLGVRDLCRRFLPNCESKDANDRMVAALRRAKTPAACVAALVPSRARRAPRLVQHIGLHIFYRKLCYEAHFATAARRAALDDAVASSLADGDRAHRRLAAFVWFGTGVVRDEGLGRDMATLADEFLPSAHDAVLWMRAHPGFASTCTGASPSADGDGCAPEDILAIYVRLLNFELPEVPRRGASDHAGTSAERTDLAASAVATLMDAVSHKST